MRDKSRIKERQMERFKEMDTTEIDQITTIVCEVFNQSKEKIIKKDNHREYVLPRQTIMYFASIKGIPLWFTGAYLGWRDHTTVIHGREKVYFTHLKYKSYRDKFNMVESRLKVAEELITAAGEISETIKDLDSFY